MAASFYSHHHQLAERRPIRAGKKQKPGGMGSATATAPLQSPTRFPSTVIVCQLIENPARWQDV